MNRFGRGFRNRNPLVPLAAAACDVAYLDFNDRVAIPGELFRLYGGGSVPGGGT